MELLAYIHGLEAFLALGRCIPFAVDFPGEALGPVGVAEAVDGEEDAHRGVYHEVADRVLERWRACRVERALCLALRPVARSLVLSHCGVDCLIVFQFI